MTTIWDIDMIVNLTWSGLLILISTLMIVNRRTILLAEHQALKTAEAAALNASPRRASRRPTSRPPSFDANALPVRVSTFRGKSKYEQEEALGWRKWLSLERVWPYDCCVSSVMNVILHLDVTTSRGIMPDWLRSWFALGIVAVIVTSALRAFYVTAKLGAMADGDLRTTRFRGAGYVYFVLGTCTWIMWAVCAAGASTGFEDPPSQDLHERYTAIWQFWASGTLVLGVCVWDYSLFQIASVLETTDALRKYYRLAFVINIITAGLAPYVVYTSVGTVTESNAADFPDHNSNEYPPWAAFFVIYNVGWTVVLYSTWRNIHPDTWGQLMCMSSTPHSDSSVSTRLQDIPAGTNSAITSDNTSVGSADAEP